MLEKLIDLHDLHNLNAIIKIRSSFSIWFFSFQGDN